MGKELTQPAPEEGVVDNGDASLELEHMICANCLDDGYRIMLCGTPLDALPKVEYVPAGTTITITPCAVCFASPTLTCNRCGALIECR